MRKTLRVWRLRSHLSALLVVTMLLTFALVGGAILAWRIPKIEHANWLAAQHEVREMRARVELLLGARQTRLELLETVLDDAPADQANRLLDSGVRDGDMLRVVYRVSSAGKIVAAGVPEALGAQRQDLLGSDLSANSLFRTVASGSGVAWNGKYPSMVTGTATVGVAARDVHGDVLIAEFPLSALLTVVSVAAGGRATSTWVVDRGGEIVADTKQGQEAGKLNIRNWPLMQSVLQGRDSVETFHYRGSEFQAAVSHSPALGWYFVGQTPVGWANPGVRNLVIAVAGAVFCGLLIGLVIAPFWATRMARPLRQLIERAGRSTSPQGAGQAWPRGSVAEFNRLAGDLEAMTSTLQEREQKSQEIFNASPVPMAVADADDDHRLLDVNQAWCREYAHRREDVVGRTALDIGLWLEPTARVALRDHAEKGESIDDVWLRRSDGSTVLVQLHARLLVLRRQRLMIWATIDHGPLRRIEQELRELNQELELRVEQRTLALAAANGELSLTVEQLRAARAELVRAEKMAALGHLVAGVAHELNTPIGNGVMALSAMADATHGFRAAMQTGLRRVELQQFVASVEQGTDIAGRNLQRAAELVRSFKQVAVDQTSSKRRSFELSEVVHEMVVSLRPTFNRTPYQVEVNVPQTGLRLDSYPGALGQAIGNLMQNAVVHGFDGRGHGTVRIDAQRAEDGRIVLRVADDGRGIAAEHIGRIFEPFMTTKMGRGGTGLGLHISYNAVVNVLGGSLTVQSVPGEGSCFELQLPSEAPDSRPAALGAA
ncbi:ATP-binding protein [Pseudorhodoferax soli]|uniref:histidine kinase n=1 Tax=Pseudorhodoferax soli TaxID=545864 RepID=A0A368YBA0_9BURK|nr:ATP-binding protein [Pseudorhodoferax soli]RCW75474.1 PAS domain S-box-containing protein [Pseudorhodoferax soli]